MSHFFKVVVLAADSQALLAVGHSGGFSLAVAEYNVFELVHASVGEHQRRVVLDYHRGRGHYAMAFIAEKVFESFAYFFGCHCVACINGLIGHTPQNRMICKISKKRLILQDEKPLWAFCA